MTAKGLEFDDVVILDGDWTSTSRDEDIDAPRRLFYVAMTRARRSLSVFARDKHPFVHGPPEAVLRRHIPSEPRQLAGEPHRYQPAEMSLVDLSFAGRLPDWNPTHAAIAAAKVGETLQLVKGPKGWLIQNMHGQTIGRMSRSFQIPEGWQVHRAEVGAIVQWRRADNHPDYHDGLKRDVWETVLPDLNYAQAER